MDLKNWLIRVHLNLEGDFCLVWRNPTVSKFNWSFGGCWRGGRLGIFNRRKDQQRCCDHSQWRNQPNPALQRIFFDRFIKANTPMRLLAVVDVDFWFAYPGVGDRLRQGFAVG